MVTLNQIITKYEELFFIRPLDSKIYLVNNKLRESELPCPKDFAKDAIHHIFKPDSGKKISKREQKKIAADSISFNVAKTVLKQCYFTLISYLLSTFSKIPKITSS